MKAEHIAISLRVAKHLETQMARSFSELYGCCYRSPDGLSCAIGCLITDDMYHHSIEGATVASDAVHRILRGSGIEGSEELEGALMYWQQYHDGMSGGPKYSDWLAEPEKFVSPMEFHEALPSMLS